MKNSSSHYSWRFITLFMFLITGFVSIQGNQFRNMTTENGLQNNSVSAIVKDSANFVWIGTKSTLTRFDGQEMKKYSMPENEEILSIEELNAHILLIGTSQNLYEFDPKLNKILTIKIFNKPSRVKVIKRISPNEYFVGTELGLYLVKNGKTRSYKKIIFDSGILSSNHITAIAKGQGAIYWFATTNGLGEYNISQNTTRHYKLAPGSDNSNEFRCLSIINNILYLGSFNKGVFSFEPNKHLFEKINCFNNDFTLSMDQYGDKLYVGTDGKGLKVYSVTQKKIVDVFSKRGKQLSSNTISAIRCYDGIIWIGTLSHGLYYNPAIGEKFSCYKTKGFNSSDYNVRCLFSMKNGDKLIGTRSGLIFVSEERNIVKIYTTDDKKSILRSDIILFIDELDGKILVGTYGGGVYVFDPHKLSLSNFSPNEPFINGCFFRFIKDRAGNLWFATEQGLYCSKIDGTVLRKYDTTNSGLVDNVIIYLYQDSQNRLYLSTHFGLCLMEPGTNIIRANILNSKYNEILNMVNYIMEDSHHNIWLCSNQGLVKMNTDLVPLAYYSGNNYVPGNIAKSVAEDNNGNIWVATLSQIVEYNIKSNMVYTYQLEDGLTGDNFNNNVIKSSDGILWWANEGGLIYINKKDNGVSIRKKLHPTIISYYVSNIEYSLLPSNNETITLDEKQNNISIKFSYLDYSLPYAEVFEYKLEGYDKEWKKQIGRNEVTYTSLPVGDYVFRLRSPELHPGEQSTLHFTIRRSYATVIWIAIVCVVTIIVLALASTKVRKLTKRIKEERKIWAKLHDSNKVPSSLSISDEKAQRLLDNLLSIIQSEKPFLNPVLKIADISKMLQCTSTELSEVLNKHMGINFADFINMYRVNEVKYLLNHDTLSKYTLKALSEQCGFNSKSTFYRVFKKVTGNTPLEYCKNKNISIKEE